MKKVGQRKPDIVLEMKEQIASATAKSLAVTELGTRRSSREAG